MENKNLDELIFFGETSKDYSFLGHMITFRTLYDHENEKIASLSLQQELEFREVFRMKEVLKYSIKFINGTCFPNVEEFLMKLQEVQFVELVNLYKEFHDWLNEDSDQVIFQAIKMIVQKPYSRWHWVFLKETNFKSWDGKWNFYRKEWINQNAYNEKKIELESTKSFVELICSFINPEAMRDFRSAMYAGMNTSAKSEELMKKAVAGEAFEEELDPTIADAYKNQPSDLDEIDILGAGNGG